MRKILEIFSKQKSISLSAKTRRQTFCSVSCNIRSIIHVVPHVRLSRRRSMPISYYSHANVGNQAWGQPMVITMRSLAIGDVNRLLWHGRTVAIAAPSDGPPTSLDAGVAGANPNRVPTLLFIASLSIRLFSPSRSRATLDSFSSGVSSSGRIIDRSLEIHQVAASRTLIPRRRRRRRANRSIRLAFNGAKWTELDLLIAHTIVLAR